MNIEVVIEAGREIVALKHPILPEFVREFHLSTLCQPVPEVFLSTARLSTARSETLKVPARVWRDYYEGVLLTVDDSARLDQIGAPTLSLWGEQDAISGREEQVRRAAAIPDATFRIYPDAGHAVVWERPEWLVRDVEEFINDTCPA